MTRPDWESRYTGGDKPWDVGVPDQHLIDTIRERSIPPGAALEIGCGTGTNALWLASAGFEVLGVDLAPSAIAAAEAKAAGAPRVRFARLDFLREEPPGGPFGFAFDRGCFHVFDDEADRIAFARRVAASLVPGGLWLSVLGSTEGPPRDHGPPRRSARDVALAIEPALEIVELRGADFVADIPSPARAWLCLARRRVIDAQPSTRR